jgi:hypothetical protein
VLEIAVIVHVLYLHILVGHLSGIIVQINAQSVQLSNNAIHLSRLQMILVCPQSHCGQVMASVGLASAIR